MSHPIPEDAQRLAKALGGKIHPEQPDTIHVGDCLIYPSLNGKVRASRMGAKVETLGHWDDPTDDLAAAFRQWAGLRVTA